MPSALDDFLRRTTFKYVATALHQDCNYMWWTKCIYEYFVMMNHKFCGTSKDVCGTIVHVVTLADGLVGCIWRLL